MKFLPSLFSSLWHSFHNVSAHASVPRRATVTTKAGSQKRTRKLNSAQKHEPNTARSWCPHQKCEPSLWPEPFLMAFFANGILDEHVSEELMSPSERHCQLFPPMEILLKPDGPGFSAHWWSTHSQIQNIYCCLFETSRLCFPSKNVGQEKFYPSNHPCIDAEVFFPHQQWLLNSIMDFQCGTGFWFLATFGKGQSTDFTFLPQWNPAWSILRNLS